MWVRLPPRAPVLNFQEFCQRIWPREARKGMETLARRAERGEPQNHWAALCAAQKMVAEKSERLVLVYLYNSARTHFIKNS